MFFVCLPGMCPWLLSHLVHALALLPAWSLEASGSSRCLIFQLQQDEEMLQMVTSHDGRCGTQTTGPPVSVCLWWLRSVRLSLGLIHPCMKIQTWSRIMMCSQHQLSVLWFIFNLLLLLLFLNMLVYKHCQKLFYLLQVWSIPGQIGTYFLVNTFWVSYSRSTRICLHISKPAM